MLALLPFMEHLISFQRTAWPLIKQTNSWPWMPQPYKWSKHILKEDLDAVENFTEASLQKDLENINA